MTTTFEVVFVVMFVNKSLGTIDRNLAAFSREVCIVSVTHTERFSLQKHATRKEKLQGHKRRAQFKQIEMLRDLDVRLRASWRVMNTCRVGN